MSDRVKIPVKHACPAGGQGDIIADAGSFQCLSCGKEWVTSFQLKDFYQLYREEIAADIRDHDKKWMAEHWGFSTQRLGQLRRSFFPDSTVPEPAKQKPAAAPGPGPYGLPAWCDTWNHQVQLRWLEIWYSFKVEEVKQKNE